jgi:hypothetical protein
MGARAWITLLPVDRRTVSSAICGLHDGERLPTTIVRHQERLRAAPCPAGGPVYPCSWRALFENPIAAPSHALCNEQSARRRRDARQGSI